MAIIIIVVASAIAAGIKELVGNALGGLSYGKTLATAASAAVLIIGVFAALNQLQIAPAIVNGLFYAILAIVVGSAIVAIGGSGIQPLRSRWENTLQRYDAEKPNMAGAGDRMKQRADEVLGQAKTQTNAGSSSAVGRTNN